MRYLPLAFLLLACGDLTTDKVRPPEVAVVSEESEGPTEADFARVCAERRGVIQNGVCLYVRWFRDFGTGVAAEIQDHEIADVAAGSRIVAEGIAEGEVFLGGSRIGSVPFHALAAADGKVKLRLGPGTFELLHVWAVECLGAVSLEIVSCPL